MITTEYVVLYLEGCTIDAEVVIEDGQAIDANEVFLETDHTPRIAIKASDLYEVTLDKLYNTAENQYRKFLEADES